MKFNFNYSYVFNSFCSEHEMTIENCSVSELKFLLYRMVKKSNFMEEIAILFPNILVHHRRQGGENFSGNSLAAVRHDSFRISKYHSLNTLINRRGERDVAMYANESRLIDVI